jgi:sulfatase modifying factor 1
MKRYTLSLLLLPGLAWAEPASLTNSVGIKLVPIPAGQFIQGFGTESPKTLADWSKRDYDEVPAHPVKISKPFLMGATEITNAQYEQFDPNHKKLRGLEGVSKGDDEPVTYVTWQQAVDYCNWLSKKEGKPYRLPTEAEWEYACRAGTTTLFNTGDTLASDQANLGVDKEGKVVPTTVKVGSYPANAWGLHDMHGNVGEWCHDWYGAYEPGEQTDPVGRADGYARVTRGWSYHRPERTMNPIKYWRSANRSGFTADDANRLTGFRVVQGELPATKPLPVQSELHQKDVKQTPAPKEAKAEPFYINYTDAKKNATIPAGSYGPIFSEHNHFGAVTICPNGDVLKVWYTCVNEPGREMSQAASRLRVGSDKWEPATLFFDVPDVNDHAPVLLTEGDRIYHFSTQSLKGWDNATNIVRYSDDNGVTWSKPTIMLPRESPQALSQPCSAIVAKDGTIVVACDGDLHKDERLMTSSDRGKTWQVRKGDNVATAGRYVIHPAIAQLEDGRIINFLRDPDPMPVQFSKDLGDSWTQRDTPFPGIKSGQKAVALKLASKALMLVSMDNKGTIVDKGKTFAALSFDDGETWSHVRQLDGVRGYMSGAQAPDGTIYVVGTKQSAIAFNEAWLKQGKPPGKK